jgi:RNA polymerase subunit RPABC4/transcription elongation factor Spt4
MKKRKGCKTCRYYTENDICHCPMGACKKIKLENWRKILNISYKKA